MAAISAPIDYGKLFSAEGLVAVITGGGTGIGLMMAKTLENNGATVYIIGRRKEVLEKAASEHAKFGKIIPIQGDVTSRESILSVVSQIEERAGYINLLVNNSGTFGPTTSIPKDADIKIFQKLLWDIPQDEFMQTINLNLTGVYYFTVAFLDLLDKGNKHGGIPGVTSQVITTSSIAGFRRDNTQIGFAYTLSKVAANHISKMFSNFLAQYQIRSNAIAPGLYPSEMADRFGVSQTTVPTSFIPLGRVGTMEDMAGSILFLATRAGAYVNGNITITDGGRLGLFSSTY